MFTRLVAPLVAVLVVTACSAGTPATSSPTAVAPSAAPSSGVITLPKPEKTSVKIGASGVPTIGLLPQLVARAEGIFKKYGMEVEYVHFNGAGPALQALVAGQVDVGDFGTAVVSSLATSSPLLTVFVVRDNLTDSLYGGKDVKTAADLKGKNIAISSFGSQSHAGALLSLRKLGLTDKEVTITPIGNDTARLAALRAGSVAASMQDGALQKDLTAQGFNVIVDLTKVEGLGGTPRTGLVISPEFKQKYPNTVLALTAAYLEGMVQMRKSAERDAEILAEAAKLKPDEAKQQVTTELAAPWTPRDGKCDPKVMDFTKQVLLPSNPTLANVDASKACDNSFLDRLASLGLQKQLGLPGY